VLEIHDERYGNGFSHYDWKLFPYIEDRIKNERVSMKKICKTVNKGRNQYQLCNP